MSPFDTSTSFHKWNRAKCLGYAYSCRPPLARRLLASCAPHGHIRSPVYHMSYPAYARSLHVYLMNMEEANGPECCRAAAFAGLLFVRRRQTRQRVGLTDATSSAKSNESRKGLPSFDSEVDPSEFVFCRNADGSQVCLGEGNFGKARPRPTYVCCGKYLLRPHV